MASRLVNVRLDEGRLRTVRKLRENGIAISDVVREAIDRRFNQLPTTRKPRDVDAIMKRIYARFPAQADERPLPYDVNDRHAARRTILRKLRRRRHR